MGTFININPTLRPTLVQIVSSTSTVSEYINPTRIRPTKLFRPPSDRVTTSSRLPTSYTPRPERTTLTTGEMSRNFIFNRC